MTRTLLARFECGRLASALIVVALLLSGECDAQATRTITETRTSTVTAFVSSDYVCAKLVNITGACRFRRGRLVDEPEIFTFDEEVEAYVDKVYANYQQFLEAKVMGVEPTVLSVMPFRPGGSSDAAPDLASSVDVIQSSISTTPRGRVDRTFLSNGDTISAGGINRKPRIYFSELNALFNAIASFLGVNPTVTVTATNVFTVTRTLTTGTSSSFIVMGCTPTPFPYNVCPSRKRRSQS